MTLRTASRALAAATLAVVLAACGGASEEASSTPGSPGVDTAADDTDDTDGTASDDTATQDTGSDGTIADTGTDAPDTTFAQVTTRVVGTAVAGNSGGVGEDQTNSFSEAVRNDDGTCSGWAGPGDDSWTAGLESDTDVAILDDEGARIGTGRIGTSSWEDVDPSDGEQWNCTFPFEAEVSGSPDTFWIQVGDLPAWRARPDPLEPGSFVVSVDTTARFDVFAECTEPLDGLTEVFENPVVGQFWANGIPSTCASGLVVVDIERPCRPQGFASEHIVAVTRADDPSVVIEDADGYVADVGELDVGTEVVVHVATGRPCG